MSSNILKPKTWAYPEDGSSRPVRIDKNVVFPAPLWPNRANI
jgi:hypothetical protein